MILAIIQARLTSTRFPRKILADINGKTMLQHVIDNVNESVVDKVVVAIPKGQRIPFEDADKFEGEEIDVLDRYYQCAKFYNADIIIRITSDCPLVNKDLINTVIHEFYNHSFPYLVLAPVSGLDVEIFNYEILKEAWEVTTDLYDREHVTPYMKRATNLSIDTLEDLKKVKRWIGKEQKKSYH